MTASKTDDDGVITEIPDLRIELSHREDMVLLEQRDYSGDVDRISIHATQVRLIAEHMGISHELGVPERALLKMKQREIDGLVRDRSRLRLVLLTIRDRSETLLRNLHLTEQAGHEDLTREVTQAGALCDVAGLACSDFEDQFDCPERHLAGGTIPLPLPVPRAKDPIKGGLARPKDEGASPTVDMLLLPDVAA